MDPELNVDKMNRFISGYITPTVDNLDALEAAERHGDDPKYVEKYMETVGNHLRTSLEKSKMTTEEQDYCYTDLMENTQIYFDCKASLMQSEEEKNAKAYLEGKAQATKELFTYEGKYMEPDRLEEETIMWIRELVYNPVQVEQDANKRYSYQGFDPLEMAKFVSSRNLRKLKSGEYAVDKITLRDDMKCIAIILLSRGTNLSKAMLRMPAAVITMAMKLKAKYGIVDRVSPGPGLSVTMARLSTIIVPQICYTLNKFPFHNIKVADPKVPACMQFSAFASVIPQSESQRLLPVHLIYLQHLDATINRLKSPYEKLVTFQQASFRSTLYSEKVRAHVCKTVGLLPKGKHDKDIAECLVWYSANMPRYNF